MLLEHLYSFFVQYVKQQTNGYLLSFIYILLFMFNTCAYNYKVFTSQINFDG